jgi:hypothetical protein
MGETIRRGARAERPKEINLARIPEQDLNYNMERFGYKEMVTETLEGTNGRKASRDAFGQRICLECTITSMLLGGNARRVEAVPILLAKNRPNYNLLIFLSRKYGTEGRLLGLLKVMNRIKKSEETEYDIKALETFKTAEEKVNEETIKKKMRLYHAY